MTLHPLPLRLWPRQALIGAVQAYRYLLKPWLGNACRFEPTCSAYALEALRLHGARRGAALAGWRLAHCHPWCEGGIDPVPAQWPLGRGAAASANGVQPGLFTRLVPATALADSAQPAEPAADLPTGRPGPEVRVPSRRDLP